MYPVLFEVFGLPITSYGVSKALAALAAWFLLRREFRRLGWDPDIAINVVVVGMVVGFLGGKLYYLAEHYERLTVHHFGGAGFTWYGGLIAGLAAFVVVIRRHRLPLVTAAAVAAAPLSVAYGIGRLGCLLAGDGTYGRPTNLPWGMVFPHGMVPTMVPVHPTPLYEALAAFLIAAILWSVRIRWNPLAVIAAYAVLTGGARFLVEFLRVNEPALLGLTQPHLWSVALTVAGVVMLLIVARRRVGPADTENARALTDDVTPQPDPARTAEPRTSPMPTGSELE